MVEPDVPIGRVETVAVVTKFRFGIVILCREAMAEEVGKGAGLGNDAAEVVVLVNCDDVAGFINVLRYVAVVVVGGEIELAVTRHGK